MLCLPGQKSYAIAGLQRFSWLFLATVLHLYYSHLVQLESGRVVQQFLLSFRTVAIYTLLLIFMRSSPIVFKFNLVDKSRRKLMR